MKGFTFFILLGISSALQAQINQFNENGTRQGTWKKYYENTEYLRYEGQFDQGVELGEFRFYRKGYAHQPSAIKVFSQQGKVAEVTFYTQRGGIICTGKEIDRKRVGKWIYYHKDGKTILSEEHYDDNGKLSGPQRTFYKNGALSETVDYLNGQKHGKELVYSLKGVLIKEFTYENGLLQGINKFYSGKGYVTIKGMYKANRKVGVWEYFNEKGEIVDTKRYKV